MSKFRHGIENRPIVNNPIQLLPLLFLSPLLVTKQIIVATFCHRLFDQIN